MQRRITLSELAALSELSALLQYKRKIDPYQIDGLFFLLSEHAGSVNATRLAEQISAMGFTGECTLERQLAPHGITLLLRMQNGVVKVLQVDHLPSLIKRALTSGALADQALMIYWYRLITQVTKALKRVLPHCVISGASLRKMTHQIREDVVMQRRPAPLTSVHDPYQLCDMVNE